MYLLLENGSDSPAIAMLVFGGGSYKSSDSASPKVYPETISSFRAGKHAENEVLAIV